MSTSKHLALAAATAASVLAAAPSGAAASGFACSASPISGTLLGQTLEPARAGSGEACETASQVVSPLPPPLAGDTAAAQTGEAGGRAQATAWLSGLRLGGLGGLAPRLREVPLPDGIGALPVPLGPVAALLGLPQTITVDATEAARELVRERALPDVAVVGADLVRTAVGGACDAGVLGLKGASVVEGLSALGVPLAPDRPIDTAVPLVPAELVDFSRLDVAGIVLPDGLSLADPLLGPVLRTALQPVVDALPTLSVPAEVARVVVEPAAQDGSAGSLRQLGPRVTIDLLGQRIADLRLGDALVSGACSAAAAPGAEPEPEPAPAAAEALECAPSDVVLTDVHEHGRRVRLLGVAAPRFAGRRVRLVLTHTGRTVARARVRPDGSFRTHAPLPPDAIRWSNDARYQAVAGGERSLALKLHRRMRITRMTSEGGTLTIKGRVYGPRTGDDVVISRRVSCHRDRAVTRVEPGPDGRWRVRLPLPEGVDAATYRATTSVRDDDSPRRFRTFTLPGYVSL